MKCVIVCLLGALVARVAGGRDGNQVQQRFRSYDVVTDLVDVAPPVYLDVTYPRNIRLSFGRVLAPSEAQEPPAIIWKSEPNGMYNLMMVDPDNPTVPQHGNRSAKRWLVGNIQGTDFASGTILAAYSGPRPGAGSGLHRYVFLLYRQNGRIEFDDAVPQSEEERYHFNVRDFVRKYGLGNPVAGQLFEARG